MISDCTINMCYIRYEKLLEEHSWDAIPGMVFCPRPKCNSRVVSNPQEKLAICAACQYPFCKTCRQLWHGDTAVCPATVPVCLHVCLVVEQSYNQCLRNV